jgi:hypothetical protein
MKTLQKSGGFAALYLAVAYLIGMAIFLVALDYPSITDPAQKVALLVEMQMVTFSTNLLMYVFFGVVLIVLALALYDRLQSGAPALMRAATVLGIIWAGSLIAGGMVANAGIALSSRSMPQIRPRLRWPGRESKPWRTGWATPTAKSWAACGCCRSAWPRCGPAGCPRP